MSNLEKPSTDHY